MKERLLEFLRVENKSSAQFAEEIGVQPSGISHILSGRNNPSLDFILKMLGSYKFISTDWLLFGKGPMYKEKMPQTLFDDDDFSYQHADQELIQKEPFQSDPGEAATWKDRSNTPSDQTKYDASSIRRIVWFYDNNSFEEYFPRQKENS